ncbi:MAG TPA: hypothetical protein VIT92_03715 [Burkholderiaceae bacterium]
MASNKKQFLLRLDPALWAQLEALAAQELRSVNGQIEYLLREGVARNKRFTPPALPEDDDADE